MKETFYFTHDFNAHSDEKVKSMIRKHGLEGYGIFWFLIEMLASETGRWYLRKDYDGIAYDMRTQSDRIQSIVEDFGLFDFDDKNFWNKRLDKHFDFMAQKSQKARENAEKRWAKQRSTKGKECDGNAPALKKDAKSMLIKEKKRKEKIKKENTIITEQSSPIDKKYSESFFNFSGEEFLFTQKKTDEDIPKIIESWSDEFRKLREIDGLKEDQLDFLLKWLFEDTSSDAEFWRKQIRSPLKLRKKNRDGVQYWRVLVMKIKDNFQSSQKAETPTFETF